MKSLEKFLQRISKEFIKNADTKDSVKLLGEISEKVGDDFELAFKNPKGFKPYMAIGSNLTSVEANKLPISELLYHLIRKIKSQVIETSNENIQLSSALEYIKEFEDYLLSLYGLQLKEKIKLLLKNNGFKANHYQLLFVNKHIKDGLFFHYLGLVNNQTIFLSVIIQSMKSNFSSEQLLYTAKLICNTKEDLNKLNKVAFYGPKGNRIDLIVWDDIKQSLLNKHATFDEFVELVQSFTSWDEKRSRIELSAFVKELSRDLKDYANPIRTNSLKIYNYLLTTTQTLNSKPSKKISACRVLFELLQNSLPNFHSEDEYIKLRNHTVLDRHSYSQHQKDSVHQLIGLRH